jgi:hypothetical protein
MYAMVGQSWVSTTRLVGVSVESGLHQVQGLHEEALDQLVSVGPAGAGAKQSVRNRARHEKVDSHHCSELIGVSISGP